MNDVPWTAILHCLARLADAAHRHADAAELTALCAADERFPGTLHKEVMRAVEEVNRRKGLRL